MIKVVDAAVAKSYGGQRKIHWMEIYAGENRPGFMVQTSGCRKSRRKVLKDYVVSIGAPLTTQLVVASRSLNVALRQELGSLRLFAPGRYFKVCHPVKNQKTDMVIFRENSEDIYAGIEFEAQSDKAKKLIAFCRPNLASEDSLPRNLGYRYQASFSRRHRASGAQGDCNTPLTTTSPV